jgi:hypothetical protein
LVSPPRSHAAKSMAAVICGLVLAGAALRAAGAEDVRADPSVVWLAWPREAALAGRLSVVQYT